MKVKDSIAAEFDQFSGNYTEDMTKCVPHYPKLLTCFSDCIPDDFSPDAVLDLGCGNGNVTALLLNRFPHAHYTLLDASPEMLALCKQRFAGKNVTCVEHYFRDYDFPRDRFDLNYRQLQPSSSRQRRKTMDIPDTVRCPEAGRPLRLLGPHDQQAPRSVCNAL